MLNTVKYINDNVSKISSSVSAARPKNCPRPRTWPRKTVIGIDIRVKAEAEAKILASRPGKAKISASSPNWPKRLVSRTRPAGQGQGLS